MESKEPFYNGINNPIQKKHTINIDNIKKNEERNRNFKIESDIKLGKDFTIDSKKLLGTGSFGVIYSGINNKTKEEVAIKIESLNTNTPQLIYEGKLLKILQGGGKRNKYKNFNLI